MSEGDRHGERDASAGGPADAGDGRESFRFGNGGDALPPGAPSDPLGALEREVEEALTTDGLDGDATLGVLRTALDGTLATVARLRRTTLHDAMGALADLRSDPPSFFHTLYRYWWRVETVGLERVPPRGRVLLAANRGGAPLPYETLMIADALRHAHPAHRGASPLVDGWFLELPLLGRLLHQSGATAATIVNLRRLLAREQAVIVLPEGRHGFGRGFRGRYRLGRFTDTFARVAIETGAPIVPVAVIGAEEAQPVVARLDAAGKLLGLPTLPLTPTLVPLPTKWTLHFGEPLHVAASYGPEDAAKAERVGRLRHQVRERLQGLVLEGLRRRRSIFLG